MKKPEIFLEHILESIGLIEEYTRGKINKAFLSLLGNPKNRKVYKALF